MGTGSSAIPLPRLITAKDFAHSNVITILTPNGEIIHRQEGLGADATDTVEAITKATR